MSIEQAIAFTNGLKTLSDAFRSNAKTNTESYVEGLKELDEEFEPLYEELKKIIEQFQDGSHTYAKTMVELANQYTEDIQSLYQNTYPSEVKE